LLLTNAFSIFELIIKVSVALMVLMTVLLLAAVILVRSRTAIYQRRRNVLIRRWRAIFLTAYTGDAISGSLPRIGKHEWFTIISLYVQFHDVREKDRPRAAEIHAKLDHLATSVGLAEQAMALLQRGDDADKILALDVLGQIGEIRALDGARELAQAPGPELSPSAAHCMLRLDPGFVGDFLQLLLGRSDWVRSRVETMLREVDTTILDAAMLEAAAGAPDEAKPRLLDYVGFCSSETARTICANVLADSLAPEALAAALRALVPFAGERDRETALRFTGSDELIVALSGLRLLRKCVRPDDRELLVRMLSSPDYWIRLRAAEAAVEFLATNELVEEFAAGLTDRFSRDAIAQVLAERVISARRTPKPDRRIPDSIEDAA
jgi:HEAT repeat protein